jgi:hypothetical protein
MASDTKLPDAVEHDPSRLQCRNFRGEAGESLSKGVGVDEFNQPELIA